MKRSANNSFKYCCFRQHCVNNGWEFSVTLTFSFSVLEYTSAQLAAILCPLAFIGCVALVTLLCFYHPRDQTCFRQSKTLFYTQDGFWSCSQTFWLNHLWQTANIKTENILNEYATTLSWGLQMLSDPFCSANDVAVESSLSSWN